MVPARQLIFASGVASTLRDGLWARSTLPSVTLNSPPIAAEDFAWLFLAGAVIVLLGAAMLLAKLYDLHWRREAKSTALEARIAESLLRDPSFLHLPVVATVHIPFWRGSPITVEMTGSVPRPELRQALLELALREGKARAGTVCLEDRIVVDPAMKKRAA